MTKDKALRTPVDEAVDRELGRRIHDARRAAGLTQTRLATAAGVTFQQLQKYERGTNRVAASRLVLIARALGVSAGSLLGEPGPDAITPEAGQLLHLFERCPAESRKSVLQLLRSLSGVAPTSA